MFDYVAELPSNERALRAVATMVFDKVLGRSSSAAVLMSLGDDAFSDPGIFIAKLGTIFGEGSGTLLQEMVDAWKAGIKATA